MAPSISSSSDVAPAGRGLADGRAPRRRGRSGRPRGPSSPRRWSGATTRNRASGSRLRGRGGTGRGPGRSCPGPCRRRGSRRGGCGAGTPASRGPPAGSGAAWRRGRPAAATGSGAASAAMRPTLSAQRCDCSVTTPSPASSSHQLRLEPVDAGDAGAGRVGQAPGLVDELPQPGELGSVEAQPRARRQDRAPRRPRSSAAKRLTKSTVWPSTLTSTPRSNQSLPSRRSSSVAVGDRERDERVARWPPAAPGWSPATSTVDVALRLQPRDDLGEQGDDRRARHGEVAGRAVEVDEGGEQVGRQLERVDRRRLGGPVAAAAARAVQGMVDGSLPAAVAGRPAQGRGVERGAFDDQDDAVERGWW